MTANVELDPTQTVLVVDDNEANRALARDTLEDEGYRVVLAAGGAEGIAAFEREHPDCILLDVRMPEIDGFAVCERIRALPRGPDTPVIFLTALRDIDTFDRALRAGGDDFLTKPVRPTELVVRVQTVLKLRRMRTELHEHYELLKRQRDDVMRLQLQKERLMAFVVHDLKNPVNSMDLHAQFLLRDRTLHESARESASHIRTDARQLTRMILNLLDLSKADEGKLVPRRVDVDLRALVADVLGELEVSAQARKVKLESSLDVDRGRADEDLLRRTLANLVENAIRHAPVASVVTVRSLDAGDAIELRVSDTGPGVPVDMREQVFDPFVQLSGEDSAPARGGRGLGLSFCKLAMEAHGGRIWIEDAAPGAAFCVRLPNEP
ncbi:MAG: response regulator [Byssovorax sp.]